MYRIQVCIYHKIAESRSDLSGTLPFLYHRCYQYKLECTFCYTLVRSVPGYILYMGH